MPVEEIERINSIFCPNCGMVSEDYITDDVINLAMAKIENQVMDEIDAAFKKLEKNSSGLVKAGPKPKHLPENPIRKSIDTMVISECKYCHKAVKIKPIMKMSGYYCPYCGIKEF